MRISNSQLDLYQTCGKKYKFRYVDNLKGDYTASPLLFGTAIDTALNYILESIRDKKDWSKDHANELFLEAMQKWDGENRLDFFKGDIPDELLDTYDEGDPETWEAVWDNMCKRGLNCLEVYINEVLPQIDEVLSVQDKGVVKNELDDEFVYVVDFVAKMKDGRTVLLDNKTSSAKYPKNKVIKSQQLSLYMDSFPDIKYAGYIVLLKNPAKKGINCTYQILIDEIPEDTKADSFNRLNDALTNIKEGKFEANFKSCNLYNKPCEYASLCKYGNKEGLIPAYVKKETNETKNPTSSGKSSV